MMKKTSRRAFLGGVAALPSAARVSELGPATEQGRKDQAYQIRVDAAQAQRDFPVPEHETNEDEELYPNKIGNYSKGLPHNNLGEVDLNAYSALINALSSGQNSDFESIPMGWPDVALQRKMVNPQAGLAFDLEGADSHHLRIPPAPAFSSAEEAGEAVELYWQALARDVSFTEYESNALSQAAAADLSGISDFRGPKDNGGVTPATLFRGFTAGDLAGPYLSQFLLKPIPFGAQFIDQRVRPAAAGIDYLTDYAEWLEIQNGRAPQRYDQLDRTPCYIRNGRDLALWVHQDVLFQAYFNACQILLTPVDAHDEVTGGGMGAPLNPGNPYNNSKTQIGFGTFGAPYINAQIAEVATRALKAVWYQKWFVHRRLRPEAFGGCVHNRRTDAADYPIHSDLLNSPALNEVLRRYGSYLLPMAYPEGSPLHPAYGAGHATVAGACITLLKALFDESYVIPNAAVPGPDGTALVRYAGPDADRLTVGGELNKLAANIAMARNFAGIHWRTDYAESLKLGEAIAISVLRDQRLIYSEDFAGFTFTRFDGTPITV